MGHTLHPSWASTSCKVSHPRHTSTCGLFIMEHCLHSQGGPFSFFGTNETSWTSLWVWLTHVHLFKVLVSSGISDFTPMETTWPLNNPHQKTVNSTLDLSFIELSTVTESVVNFSNGIIACKVHNPFKIPTNCGAITKIKFNILCCWDVTYFKTASQNKRIIMSSRSNTCSSCVLECFIWIWRSKIKVGTFL